MESYLSRLGLPRNTNVVTSRASKTLHRSPSISTSVSTSTVGSSASVTTSLVSSFPQPTINAPLSTSTAVTNSTYSSPSNSSKNAPLSTSQAAPSVMNNLRWVLLSIGIVACLIIAAGVWFLRKRNLRLKRAARLADAETRILPKGVRAMPLPIVEGELSPWESPTITKAAASPRQPCYNTQVPPPLSPPIASPNHFHLRATTLHRPLPPPKDQPSSYRGPFSSPEPPCINSVSPCSSISSTSTYGTRFTAGLGLGGHHDSPLLTAPTITATAAVVPSNKTINTKRASHVSRPSSISSWLNLVGIPPFSCTTKPYTGEHPPGLPPRPTSPMRTRLQLGLGMSEDTAARRSRVVSVRDEILAVYARRGREKRGAAASGQPPAMDRTAAELRREDGIFLKPLTYVPPARGKKRVQPGEGGRYPAGEAQEV